MCNPYTSNYIKCPWMVMKILGLQKELWTQSCIHYWLYSETMLPNIPLSNKLKEDIVVLLTRFSFQQVPDWHPPWREVIDNTGWTKDWAQITAARFCCVSLQSPFRILPPFRFMVQARSEATSDVTLLGTFISSVKWFTSFPQSHAVLLLTVSTAVETEN